MANHSITSIIGLEKIWALENVYIIWNEQDVTLNSAMGKTCFLGDLGKRKLYKRFICLESQSGQLLWDREDGIHRTIDVTQDGIFVAYSSGAYLNKFDLQTGDLMWQKSLIGTGSIYLYYLDNRIQVSTTNPEKLWVLDATGDVINNIRDGEHRMFLSTTSETYVNLNGLQVYKTGTNQELWEHVDTQDLRQAPIFATDEIFLRNGADFSGTAYALDRKDGKLLWETPNIVGNLVYLPDKQLVYALRENGDLLAINPRTGEANTLATFSNSPFIFFDGIDPCAYQLAYDAEKHVLVVYLGDSRQLFAFKVE